MNKSKLELPQSINQDREKQVKQRIDNLKIKLSKFQEDEKCVIRAVLDFTPQGGIIPIMTIIPKELLNEEK